MPWQSLSSRLSSLPLVICGPILRRTERESVSVWIAFRDPMSLTLHVFESPNPPSQPVLVGPMAATVQVGDNFHVAVVTANQPTNPGAFLVPEHIYGYNVVLWSVGGVGLGAPGVLNATGSPAGAIDKIAYGSFPLPSFVLPATDINDLKLAHGSCRKPHGGETDALRALDEILVTHHADPVNRPQQLFLTGDQIYADDVADVLLFLAIDAASVLLGWDERLPGYPVFVSDSALEPGNRQHTVGNAGFTSDAAKSHLIRLGEFFAMYLLVWSDALWDAELPNYGGVFPGRPTHQAISKFESFFTGVVMQVPTPAYSDFVKAAAKVAGFRGSLPFVRRALANIASYMVSDDHEVTDDWFLTWSWSETNLVSSALTRRIIQNALSAFAVFQAWGNAPSQFEGGNPGAIFLQRLHDLHVHRGAQADDWDVVGNILLPGLTPTTGSRRRLDGGFRWNFQIDFEKHRVIGLDTRTRRGFNSAGGPPCLIDGADLAAQVPTTQAGTKELTVLLSGAPVVGHPLLEKTLQPLLKDLPFKGPEDADYEFWLARRDCFEELLRQLVPYERVLILSGDVHYGFSASLEYWDRRTGTTTPAIYVQLCSSALGNEDSKTNLIANRLLSPPARTDFAGWKTPGQHLKFTSITEGITISGRVEVRRQPLVRELTTELVVIGGTVILPDEILTTPDWSYRVRFAKDTRSESDRGLPTTGPLPSQPQERAGFLHRRRGNWDAHRWVVGKDNLGSISFSWGIAKKVHHELWYAPEHQGGRLLFPYTRHTVSLDVPSVADAPR